MRIRKEEYTALGDFILPSFRRDQEIIAVRYPKLDAGFLASFADKLDFVKGLESSLVMTEKQKDTTKSLYLLAANLNNELTYLGSYVKDAGLNKEIITALKNELFKHNIEGSILKTEAVKQYVIEHKILLEAEGMPADIIDKLANYKTELETKNALQNQFMNALKQLTETNWIHYEVLYDYIATIAEKGKLVFKNTVAQDEYTLDKNLSRMRAAKQKSVEEPRLI
ncbi:MAG: hypothetical protein ABI426_07310 [Flavobacterium sp.]